MKLIVIIGAGPGISQGVARKFGKEGCKIALVARSESKLKGFVSVKDILEQDWETMKSNLDISVGGFFNLMKAILPYCMANNPGAIAEQFWKLFNQKPGEFENEIIY